MDVWYYRGESVCDFLITKDVRMDVSTIILAHPRPFTNPQLIAFETSSRERSSYVRYRNPIYSIDGIQCSIECLLQWRSCCVHEQ